MSRTHLPSPLARLQHACTCSPQIARHLTSTSPPTSAPLNPDKSIVLRLSMRLLHTHFADVFLDQNQLLVQQFFSPAARTPPPAPQGRSAGGLLMGAVLNARPDLFQSAIMGVPFVDALTTMLDESIPLTVIEWEEWGSPAQREFYEYMKSYSPVDNIRPADYPNILVTGGLHDPRVGYWEPAKFVAKLRELKTDSNLLLFKCEMGAGHFSKSGRFDRLKEVALEYAFLLKCQGMLGVEAKPAIDALEEK